MKNFEEVFDNFIWLETIRDRFIREHRLGRTDDELMVRFALNPQQLRRIKLYIDR